MKLDKTFWKIFSIILHQFSFGPALYVVVEDTLGLKTASDDGVYWSFICVQQTFFFKVLNLSFDIDFKINSGV